MMYTIEFQKDAQSDFLAKEVGSSSSFAVQIFNAFYGLDKNPLNRQRFAVGGQTMDKNY